MASIARSLLNITLDATSAELSFNTGSSSGNRAATCDDTTDKSGGLNPDPGEFSPVVLINLTVSTEEMLRDWFNKGRRT